jgi:hypothetical protein
MRTLALMAAILAGGGMARAQEDPPDPARRIRERLAATRITIDFKDARLSEVVAYFQEFSGLNFHIEQDARDKDESAERITVKLKDVSMKSALRLLLHPRDLRCVLRNGVIVITARSGARMVTRAYDIREIMLPLRDFVGPVMELVPPGGANMGVTIIFEPEDPSTPITEEMVVDLVKTCISEASWDGDASVNQVGGLLLVTQTAAVQEEIRRLLDRLRQYK